MIELSSLHSATPLPAALADASYPLFDRASRLQLRFTRLAALFARCGAMARPVSISAAFDAGNIQRVESKVADVVALQIRPDPPTELEKKTHSQWFSFRARASGPTKYEIVNAGDVSYPSAWPGYQVCASIDRKTWSRVPSTTYDPARGALCWDFDHAASGASDDVYFAYFDPYSYERHLDLIARCVAADGARVRSLGQTLDGRELECVEVGVGPLHAWVIHRQHPGESQVCASSLSHGLLPRVAPRARACARAATHMS